MNVRLLMLTLGAGVLICNPGTALSDTTAVTINYGTVDSVRTVEQKGKHAGGALAGGLLGAALAGPRHRVLKIGATAAAGAAIQGAATSGTSQLTPCVWSGAGKRASLPSRWTSGNEIASQWKPGIMQIFDA